MKFKNIFLFTFFIVFIFAGLFFVKDFVFSADCLDECDYEGQTKCNGDFIQTCLYDLPEEGCLKSVLKWYPPEPCNDNACGAGSCPEYAKPIRPGICLDGECQYSCAESEYCCTDYDECLPSQAGYPQCYGNTHWRECRAYDLDSCYRWTSPQSCQGSAECGYSQAGHDACASNERPQWFCSGNGICDYTCVESPTCKDPLTCECDNPNDICCDGCNFEPASKVCLLEINQEYVCSSEGECGSVFKTRRKQRAQYCSGFSSYCTGQWSAWSIEGWREIGCSDEEKCVSSYETRDPVCEPADYYSLGGVCYTYTGSYECKFFSECAIVDECVPGAYRCSSDGKTVEFCDNCDGEPGLDWCVYEHCPNRPSSYGYRDCLGNERPEWFCSGIQCAYICVVDPNYRDDCQGECLVFGQKQCVNNNEYFITCGQYNPSDVCYEWSSPQSCVGDTSCGYSGAYGDCADNQRPSWFCSNGECRYNCVDDLSCGFPPPPSDDCENECDERWLTECVDSSRSKVCGYNYIKDGCLHWYPPQACAGDVSCGYGTCNDNQKPNWFCDVSSDQCSYECLEDSDCVSDYIRDFSKDCYDNDVYWFDSEGERREKAEECDDDNPDTIDGCENRECFNRSEEEEYCATNDHCGDGICNCEEDIYICFEDCQLAEIAVSIFAKKESDKKGEWQESIVVFPKEELDLLLIVLNESQQDFDNVIVSVRFPQEVVYKEELKVDDVSAEGDIRSGINIGFIPKNSDKTITFKAEISSEAYAGSEAEIVSTVEIDNISESDFLSITVEKEKTNVFKWLVSRWYLWLILWVGFVAFLYWVLRRSSG